jgi:hypothetical protein
VSEINEAIERQVSDAINAAIAEHERGMVTRWISLIEIIDGDGDRALLTTGSEDLRAWDTLGILEFALALERASIVADKVREE